MSVDLNDEVTEAVAVRPFAPASPARARTRAPTAPFVDVAVVLALIGLAYGLAQAASLFSAPLTTQVEIDLSPSALPAYALASVERMTAAYLLSLVFSLVYGRLAASGRWAERVLLPVLDILQSIPILSFMPGVVLALVAVFPNNSFGLELAAIVLIFTSQAWNLAFSFYQSLRTVPGDLSEAATIARLSGWRRFTRLEVPFATIGLVWNSMMSWAGGWFFLIAAEQFTLGDKNFQLPGLGSYLKVAADTGDLIALVLGLGTLVAIIVLLDQLVWRPLVAWSEKFRFEQTESSDVMTSPVLTALRRSRLVEWMSTAVFPSVGEALDWLLSRLPRRLESGNGEYEDRHISALRRWGGTVLTIVLLVAAAVWGVSSLVQLLSGLTSDDWLALNQSQGGTRRSAVVVFR